MSVVRRFIHNYRWELTLLVGAPLTGYFTLTVATTVLTTAFADRVLEQRGHLLLVEAPIGSLALLVALRGCMRRSGRELLNLVWSLALANATLSVVIAVVRFAYGSMFAVDTVQAQVFVHSTFVLLAESGHLAILAFYARKASRISLAHGFFLYLAGGGYGLPPLATYWLVRSAGHDALDISTIALIVTLASWLQLFVTAPVLAWMLGTFDNRTTRFRTRLNAALAAFRILADPYYASVRLAVIYLARAREGPTAEDLRNGVDKAPRSRPRIPALVKEVPLATAAIAAAWLYGKVQLSVFQ